MVPSLLLPYSVSKPLQNVAVCVVPAWYGLDGYFGTAKEILQKSDSFQRYLGVVWARYNVPDMSEKRPLWAGIWMLGARYQPWPRRSPRSLASNRLVFKPTTSINPAKGHRLNFPAWTSLDLRHVVGGLTPISQLITMKPETLEQ